jgi:hypothetical protein
MPRKKKSAKTRPVKEVKIQGGALEHELIKANCEHDGISPDKRLTEILVKGFSKDLSPRNQIALLKPVAERFDAGLYDLAQAEILINDRGEALDLDEFNKCIEKARTIIGLAQVIPIVEPFITGRRKARLDNLGKAMEKAWYAFVKEEGRIPTAFELWDWIPQGGHILEKTEHMTIYWKRSNGKDAPPTSYKSFKNRYTALKKKLSSSTISK